MKSEKIAGGRFLAMLQRFDLSLDSQPTTVVLDYLSAIYIVSPVTDITGKRVSHRWKDVENTTFTESRDKLCSAPVRLHPIFDGVHEDLPNTYASGVSIDTSAEWQRLCDMTREGSSCCSFGCQPRSAVSVGTVV